MFLLILSTTSRKTQTGIIRIIKIITKHYQKYLFLTFKTRGNPSPQELAFWRVGTTEIEKSDFSSHDPGLCQVSFYITRVCRTRLDVSNPLKLCYMSRSRYNEIGPPTYLAEILNIVPTIHKNKKNQNEELYIQKCSHIKRHYF